MKRMLRISAYALLGLALAFAGLVWWMLQPRPQNLTLPEALIAISTPQGRALVRTAEYRADLPLLESTWEAQKLVSYCGVASGVAVLNALGDSRTQDTFFTPAASHVRSRLAVTFGGMSRADLAGLLEAHGLEVDVVHGSESSIEAFRAAVQVNLSDPADFMLVNYQRAVLGQGQVGHISPLGAYDSASDRVLILDTAAYKYPHTWVPLDTLYDAMATVDPASGRSRGYLSVKR